MLHLRSTRLRLRLVQYQYQLVLLLCHTAVPHSTRHWTRMKWDSNEIVEFHGIQWNSTSATSRLHVEKMSHRSRSSQVFTCPVGCHAPFHTCTSQKSGNDSPMGKSSHCFRLFLVATIIGVCSGLQHLQHMVSLWWIWANHPDVSIH